jgi:hypothetical protein
MVKYPVERSVAFKSGQNEVAGQGWVSGKIRIELSGFQNSYRDLKIVSFIDVIGVRKTRRDRAEAQQSCQHEQDKPENRLLGFSQRYSC